MRGFGQGVLADNRGLTLLEVVVAMVIIGVALIPVMSMFNSGFLIYTTARDESIALALAHGKMEELFTVPYEDLDDRDGETAAFTGDFAPYAYAIAVEEYPGFTLRKLTLSVYPQADPGERLTLVTLRGRW